jgi:uncharacterized protein
MLGEEARDDRSLFGSPVSRPAEEPALTDDAAVLASVQAAARQRFEQANGSHDWEHTQRVVRLCEHIGRAEGADLLVLRIAAYLHDIGRCIQDASRGALCHAREGARLARPLIDELPLAVSRRQNILHCIRSHRFRGNSKPQSLEARVLFDADKLDAIGAVGIARAYLFAGELGACLHNPLLRAEEAKAYSKDDTGYREYAVKLSKIKDRMLTRTARQMAEERHAFMAQFFNRFLEEYEGKR